MSTLDRVDILAVVTASPATCTGGVVSGGVAVVADISDDRAPILPVVSTAADLIVICGRRSQGSIRERVRRWLTSWDSRTRSDSKSAAVLCRHNNEQDRVLY